MPSMQLTLAFINARLWNPPSTCRSVHVHTDVTMATALGVEGSRIRVIGSDEEVLAHCGDRTRVIDAQNGLLIPGFTDCHVHFLDGGYRLLSVSLRECKSRNEFVQVLSDHIATLSPGTWVLGGNWDHQQWGGILPDKSWIDSISPHNPVWLNRLDGHMYLANSVAMKLAGVDSTTPDLPGGTIVRMEGGREPSGIFKDNATNWIVRAIPPRQYEECCAALEAAMSYVAARGVTKVHTMVTVDCHSGLWPSNMGRDADKQDVELAFSEVKLYRDFMKQRKLRTRIRAALPVAAWRRVMREMLGEDNILELSNHSNGDVNHGGDSMERRRKYQMLDPDEFLQLGVLKAQMDGSLGTHTAAFHEDYTDTPGYKGDFIWDPAILTEHVQNAAHHGLDVCVHAIGDHANTVTLDLFETVAKRLGDDYSARFRIEHAQHLRKCDIPRFGSLNVVASMQMSHLADDGCWATDAIGLERMRTSWPMKSLLDSGAVVALGSDWFVAEPSPLQGIYDAVTRNTRDGGEGVVEEERVSVEEALIGYTSGAAYAAHEEDRRGLLGAGMLADVVLLDRNILDIDIEDIMRTRVIITVVNGDVVFDVNNPLTNDK